MNILQSRKRIFKLFLQFMIFPNLSEVDKFQRAHPVVIIETFVDFAEAALSQFIQNLISFVFDVNAFCLPRCCLLLRMRVMLRRVTCSARNRIRTRGLDWNFELLFYAWPALSAHFDIFLFVSRIPDLGQCYFCLYHFFLFLRRRALPVFNFFWRLNWRLFDLSRTHERILILSFSNFDRIAFFSLDRRLRQPRNA